MKGAHELCVIRHFVTWYSKIFLGTKWISEHLKLRRSRKEAAFRIKYRAPCLKRSVR
jgi:hypothetical protein